MSTDYSTMAMPELEELRSVMLDRIAAVPAFRRGSLQVGYRKCGRANCRCAPSRRAGTRPTWAVDSHRQGPGWLARAVHPPLEAIDQVRGELETYAQFAALVEDHVEINEVLCTARVGPPARRPRRADPAAGGERGLERRSDEQEALSALADQIAELAAEQAHDLVATAAGLLRLGEPHPRVGVLEAIERAAQAAAAQIGLAALAGVVDWAGTHSGPRQLPPPGHVGPGAGRSAQLVARRTKTVRTLLGSIQTTRGYYRIQQQR
jgi:hypothetical protein